MFLLSVSSNHQILTLSVPVVFLNSPNLSPYFSLNKFERIWLLIFSSWFCLINSHFLITKCHILYVLYKEKLVVDNWLALKGLNKFVAESCHVPFTRGIWRVVTREDRSSRPGLCLISASELGHVSLWRALCASFNVILCALHSREPAYF